MLKLVLSTYKMNMVFIECFKKMSYFQRYSVLPLLINSAVEYKQLVYNPAEMWFPL